MQANRIEHRVGQVLAQKWQGHVLVQIVFAGVVLR
jgi:hypothetical protein